jgi:adenylosuccinate lyase
MANQWISIPMLARTHGQPATPTTVGKEIRVFQARLENAKASLQSLPIPAKFGGATGSFNAHKVAYPQYHWPKLADQFLTEKFGLQRTQITTQIENYDGLAALLDAMARINIIIIDACRDFWTYISMEYFSQKTKPGEIGSSAMPHKVNPIDFENAEGNAGFSAAIAGHLSRTLPISRLQRDLTDSTLLRNIGLPFAHSLLAFKSMLKGLASLELNENKIRVDLNQNWEVLAEAVQTILRREGYPKPYETLLNLTRGKESLTPSAYLDFINQLEIREEVKAELRQLSPWDYLGYAPVS